MGARVLLLSLLGGVSCWLPAAALRLETGPQVPPRLAEVAHAQVHRPRGVLMGWTARAACSFALEIWTQFLGCYDKAVNYSSTGSWIHNYRIDVVDHLGGLGGKATPEDMSNSTLFKFKVTMNPFHRAVTMYTHAMQYNWTVTTAETAEAQAIADKFHQDVRSITLSRFGVDDPNNLTFLQFLQVLEALGELSQYPHGVAVHYSPQAEQPEPAWDVRCKVERIRDCLTEVNSKTGSNFTLPPKDSAEAQRHNTQHVPFGEQVAGKPYSTILAMKSGAMPLTEDFYSGTAGAEAIRLVTDSYAQDFSRFGYDPTLLPTSADFNGSLSLLD